MKQPITTEAIQAIIDYIDEGAPDMNVVRGELSELILRSRGEYWEKRLTRATSEFKLEEEPPKPPVGPPCRQFNSGWFGAMIETEESKRATEEWRDNNENNKS
jgi:hypothetical protein